VDRPGGKKIHGQATPLLGGVAIALALAAGMAASGTADQASLRILVATGFILLLGIWDDLDPHAEALRWWLRLLYEGCLAGIVVAGGVRIHVLGVPWLEVPVTLVWIVGITNAFNLLDNMNGLSAGVAAIAAVTFALLAARYVEVGPSNSRRRRPRRRSPARASVFFLPISGRASSWGTRAACPWVFSLPVLAVQGSWRSPTVPTSVIIPLLVLAYPLFDTALGGHLASPARAIPRGGGRDHSSHRLVRLGLGRVETGAVDLPVRHLPGAHGPAGLLGDAPSFPAGAGRERQRPVHLRHGLAQGARLGVSTPGGRSRPWHRNWIAWCAPW